MRIAAACDPVMILTARFARAQVGTRYHSIGVLVPRDAEPLEPINTRVRYELQRGSDTVHGTFPDSLSVAGSAPNVDPDSVILGCCEEPHQTWFRQILLYC